jgi:hypothetical protein
MVSRFQVRVLLVLLLAGAGLGQTPPPPGASNSRIYILVKAGVAEPGAGHDAFAQRMTAMGVLNLQFVTGANAVRCEAPAAAQAAIAADADVTGVLPLDAAPTLAPAIIGPATPTPVPLPGPVVATPPYIPPQPGIPITNGVPIGGVPIGGVPIGGGLSAGMTMLTDFAGNVVVKLLTPGASCKIHLHSVAPAIPAAGGAGAFEVKASGNCAWQAVSTAGWLQVRADVNAAGTTAVTYAAAANSSGSRHAVVVIQPVAGLAPLKGHTVILVSQQ